ncbi:oligosaccharide flippase family protein [Metabacillus fastidiosus]|uniref:oligosaccharide flippase family protein n=1 Tax=Metabacillus fastidiosus TaxID=1458 RepID=UPI002E1F6FCC|nr:oligosaccharide flippase family protein [Metabacillus fastidiosus]MED4534437.1 oligosaccharide flippase family protein [Metabacillus fastidiosus]
MVLKHLKNLLYLFLSKALSSFFAFIAQILIARLLTQEDYGTIAFYIILINIISSIIGFGLGNFWLWKFAIERNNVRRWIKATVNTILLLSIVSVPLYILIPYFTLGSYSLYISVTLLPLLLYQGFESVVIASFQMRNEYTKLSYYMMVKNSILLISSLILFIFEFQSFILSYGLLSVALLLYSLTIVGKLNKKLKVERFEKNAYSEKITIKKVFTSAWPFGAQGILYMLYYQVGIVIITILLGTTSTGFYNASFTIISFVFVFSSILFQIYLLPRSNIWIARKDFNKVTFLRNKVTFLFFLIGIFITVIFYYIGEFLITLLYGKAFLDSVLLFKVLILAIPFRFISDSLGVLFTSKKMMLYKVYVQGGGALVNIILNLIFISQVGVIGAALSTVLTEVIVVILLYLFSGRLEKEMRKRV